MGDLTFKSLGSNGRANPGALGVELDIAVAMGDQPLKGSSVRVWGIGMHVISQSQNLFNKPITVKGGMSAGLPLANPAEAGLLVKGKVFQAFGNWQGTDQTLDMILTTSGEAVDKGGANPVPKQQPIIMNWPRGKQIRDPLKQALQQAFPGFSVEMAIADNYKAPSDQIGFHGGLSDFSYQVRRYTQMLAGKDSEGIGIHFHGDKIFVGDGSQPTPAPTIAYTDLIGQPTWIGVDRISVKVVMRGDLNLQQEITLPKTLVTSSAGSGEGVSGQDAPRSTLTFQGKATIIGMRHVGNFRQPDGSAWVTILECVIKK